MGTRFERDVGGRASGCPGIAHRKNFCVLFTRSMMPTASDDAPVLNHHAAHSGVRGTGVQASSGEKERFGHSLVIKRRVHQRSMVNIQGFAGQFFDLLAKLVEVLELAVDRGETHVGNMIQVFEAVHHSLANIARWNFTLTGSL